jgi:hypothetical protein
MTVLDWLPELAADLVNSDEDEDKASKFWLADRDNSRKTLERTLRKGM